MSKEQRRLDRRAFLKSLGLVAGALTLERRVVLAQPLAEEFPAGSCPLRIEIGGPIVKLRRPERKFTVYFDLLVEMPQGQLVQVKRTVRIIRAITRKFRKKEEVIFVPVAKRTKDIYKEIKDQRLSFQDEENMLIDFGYICNTLRRLSGTAFAVEILIETRGITADKGQICSANRLVIQNFDVPQVCQF
jgi:hypothetical protein